MARVLVTGAAGFIGSHLVRELLRRGHAVTCLVRPCTPSPRLASLDVATVQGDLTDPDSLARAICGQEAVFQLAGCLWASRIEPLYRVNEHGVRNLIAACAARTSPPIVVMTSSVAAAGPSPADRPRRETDPLAPVSHYGKSKRGGEAAAWQFADRVPITIVRPPIVFGDGDLATHKIFLPIARCGVHVVPTWRDHRISLIHATDLVELLLLAWQRGTRLVVQPADAAEQSQGCYFAAGDHDPTYAEFGRAIGKAQGHRRTLVVRLDPVSVWAIANISSLGSRLLGRAAYFNVDKAREAWAGSWTCSPEKAKCELGFAVAEPLEVRLRQTAEWYREHGWL